MRVAHRRHSALLGDVTNSGSLIRRLEASPPSPQAGRIRVGCSPTAPCSAGDSRCSRPRVPWKPSAWAAITPAGCAPTAPLRVGEVVGRGRPMRRRGGSLPSMLEARHSCGLRTDETVVCWGRQRGGAGRCAGGAVRCRRCRRRPLVRVTRRRQRCAAGGTTTAGRPMRRKGGSRLSRRACCSRAGCAATTPCSAGVAASSQALKPVRRMGGSPPSPAAGSTRAVCDPTEPSDAGRPGGTMCPGRRQGQFSAVSAGLFHLVRAAARRQGQLLDFGDVCSAPRAGRAVRRNRRRFHLLLRDNR